MEFVETEEVMSVLKEHGVTATTSEDGNEQRLHMTDAEGVVHVHMAPTKDVGAPREGDEFIAVAADALTEAIEGIIHKLHLNQVLLVPVGQWRHVFDAVAFSLAENEDWQEIDATATVERNTRDPLLCEAGDIHTLTALLNALLADAETPVQSLLLVTTATPVLAEVMVPDGAVRVSFGSQVLADEAMEGLR